jgi:hypothetical protein
MVGQSTRLNDEGLFRRIEGVFALVVVAFWRFVFERRQHVHHKEELPVLRDVAVRLERAQRAASERSHALLGHRNMRQREIKRENRTNQSVKRKPRIMRRSDAATINEHNRIVLSHKNCKTKISKKREKKTI